MDRSKLAISRRGCDQAQRGIRSGYSNASASTAYSPFAASWRTALQEWDAEKENEEANQLVTGRHECEHRYQDHGVIIRAGTAGRRNGRQVVNLRQRQQISGHQGRPNLLRNSFVYSKLCFFCASVGDDFLLHESRHGVSVCDRGIGVRALQAAYFPKVVYELETPPIIQSINQ